VLNRYRAAFEPSGSLSFSLSGLLGRLPVAMIGLALVLVLSADGNYALAGTVVGILALAGCVGGPLQGRLADRIGQARLLIPTTLVFAASLVGIIAALRTSAPFAVLAVLAALVGAASPTTGTLARSRWSMLHPAGGRLQTAFAVESVFDEVVFVTGPVLTTVLATQIDPLLPFVVAAVAGVTGSLLMAAQRRTQPPTGPAAAVSGAPGQTGTGLRAGVRLPYLALIPLFVVQLTVGTIFGSIDVVTVAAASAAGERGSAGLILACFSGGSLIAGLVVGGIEWRMSPVRRVRICVTTLGLATLVLPFVPGVGWLPLAGFVVGLTIAPALVAIASAVQAGTPPARLTEAMALGTSFLVAGFSLGSAVAGHLVDAVGPHRAFWQSAVAGMLAAAAVLAPVAARRVAGPAAAVLGVRSDRRQHAGHVPTAPADRRPGSAPSAGRRPPARPPSGPTVRSRRDRTTRR